MIMVDYMRDNMTADELKSLWQREEDIAYIHGWDFSHIEDRYESKEDLLPWNYKELILKYMKPEDRLLDMDTGGGEFLLSLGHPFHRTSATEGYPPNVELCKEVLLPLGINFKAADDYAALPFADEGFDVVINRHGSYDAKELYRILKPGGLFITQQVGDENDRALVELLLPGQPMAFPGMNVTVQQKVFEEAGFELLQAEEAFLPIRFMDVGALVWFARIISWEFVEFSVEKCFDQLMKAQEIINTCGYVEGMAHRYLIIARK
jgi:SAM-dependent methyltransferase